MYKRNSLITLLFICISTVFFAQSAKNKSTPPQENVVLAPEKVQQIQNKIIQIENHLQAIEVKRAYILSNPEELAIANENGWFESMADIEAGLVVKKTELLNDLNGVDDE